MSDSDLDSYDTSRRKRKGSSSDDDSSFVIFEAGSKHIDHGSQRRRRRSIKRAKGTVFSTRSNSGHSADDPIQIISDDEPIIGKTNESTNEIIVGETSESYLARLSQPFRLIWKVLKLTWGGKIVGFSVDDPHPMTVTFTNEAFEFKGRDESFPGLCVNLRERLRPFDDIACNTFHSPCFIAFRPSARGVPGLSSTDTRSHTDIDHRYFVLYFEKVDDCRAALVRDTMIKLSTKVESVVHELAAEELSRFDRTYPRPERGRTRSATQKTLEDGSLAIARNLVERRPILQYPIHATTGNRITLTEDDLDVLDPGNFLNDSIVDFYLLYLKSRFDCERFHIFNSFFYKKYTSAGSTPQAGQVESYKAVKNWTRNVDLFTKDFLIMPVCDKMHWSCVIACHPGLVREATSIDSNAPVFPCLLLLDSLGSHSGPKLFRMFRNYLTSELNERHTKAVCSEDVEVVERFPITKDNMPGFVVQVPQQTNDCDCGLFMLQYIEEFLMNPFTDFRRSQVHNPTWFDPECVVLEKRDSIRKVLLELSDQWKASQGVGGSVPDCEGITKVSADNGDISSNANDCDVPVHSNEDKADVAIDLK